MKKMSKLRMAVFALCAVVIGYGIVKHPEAAIAATAAAFGILAQLVNGS